MRKAFSALAALTLLTVLVVLPARAQEAQEITFNEAVRLALEQNVQLLQAENAAELSVIGANRRRMSFYPNLSIGTTGSQSYGRTFSQEDLAFVNESTQSFGAGVDAGVNLFNGFGDVANLRRARLNAEASEFDLDRMRQTVVFTVMQQYLALIERREQITVQQENLESAQQLLEQVRAFTEVGARPISDLYQQEAAVANAELAILTAQRLYDLAESNLIQTLQLDPFQTYAFVAPAIDEVEVTVQQYNLETLLRNAFERRVDLRAAEIDIEASRAGIRAAQATRWPSVGLSVGYDTGWNSRLRDPATRETIPVFEQFDQNRGGRIGLNLSLPIFDRFTTRYNVQTAEIEYQNAQLTLENLQQDIAVEVRQAYLDLVNARKALQVSDVQVRSAELALEAAQERYEVGAATLVEVTQQRALYISALGSQVQATYDLVFRQKLIEYYLGVLNPAEPLF